jgi:pSer/pThr/pTyr-binding forkhead associated (FHA) protein
MAGRAFLVAMTPFARTAFGAPEGELSVFPFRVGRESRVGEAPPSKAVREMRNPNNPASNELYLIEAREMMNVSREHFQIVRDGEGFALEDRGSSLGTLVEGEKIGVGGDRKRVELKDGDVIIPGSSHSPYVFKFRLR